MDSLVRRYKPGLLREIEEHCGRDAADLLAKHFGGQSVYMPAPDDMTPDNVLSLKLGFETAAAIAKAIGVPVGFWMEIPAGDFSFKVQRENEIHHFILSGASSAEVARRFGISVRSVSRNRKRLREQGLLT